ncbi:alpha-2-macroglobulin family protein [Sediminicola luteus]|uniref:Alpha-2-macroglobulin domain-containing protein n=1 Tax=Sediminicola luteus TaxID=319238 RepID=A0A2A4G9W1_9FLAO|nr:MG2 domain-containing protein [Sediminicola luteus]PCE64555.1 hypothetical protein B7P33_09745 [Sediminicola luteus]
MKSIFTLISILIVTQIGQAQDKPSYASLWKKIEKLEADQLTQSALNVAQQIYAKAEAENNTAQYTKALLYISKYSLTLEEDAQLKVVERFKNAIEKSSFPTKNILESYLAQLYWQYYQQNRWQFADRTAGAVTDADFRTWDLKRLFKETSTLYENSLARPMALQQTSLKEFAPLLHTKKWDKKGYATLFDLLALEALDFYKKDEQPLSKSAHRFQMTDPQLLCGRVDFVTQNLTHKDEKALQLKALRLFQELLQHHQRQGQTEIMALTDLDRLDFVFNQGKIIDKAMHLQTTLEEQRQLIKETPESGLYAHRMAQLWVAAGNTYAPEGKTTTQWKKKEAYALCEQVITAFPNTMAADRCAALQVEIAEKSIEINHETNLPVNKPSMVKVYHQNISELHFSLYSLSDPVFNAVKREWSALQKRKLVISEEPIKTWKAQLTNEGDFQRHNSELVLPSLPFGLYAVLAQAPDGKHYAVGQFQVTDLVLITLDTGKGKLFQIVDRNHGAPISGAEAHIVYNNHRRNALIENYTVTTDKNGRFTMNRPPSKNNSFSVRVTHKDETSYLGDHWIAAQARVQTTEKRREQALLFTDRAIYRPGQPLYYKSIVFTSFEGKSQVLPDQSVQLTLTDVNGQEVNKTELSTNDFGSVHGQFVLPNSGLNGHYNLTIRTKDGKRLGSTHFLVEEYKRPKFEVKLQPQENAVRLNETITTTGSAKTYSGAPLTKANVTYRVYRQVEYPRWCWWLPRRQETTEIAQGNTQTQADGSIEIPFQALPEAGAQPENQPVFTYTVEATVTDINGETQSSETKVRVGYHTLTAQLLLNSELDKSQKEHSLGVHITNLNGQAVSNSGSIKVYKLNAPKRVYRKRPWPAPDYNNLSQAEFHKKFPHEAYQDENEIRNWQKGDLVANLSYDTAQETQLSLANLKKWTSGQYVWELSSTDANGQAVKDVIYTRIYDAKDKRVVDNTLLQIQTDKKSYAPGETASIGLSSAVDGLALGIYMPHGGQAYSVRDIVVGPKVTWFEIEIKEVHLGGIRIPYAGAGLNQGIAGTIQIEVPFPKTELQLETVSFRDKLKPGEEESWEFTIKGPNGEQLATEILASMYDAALDAFSPHNWRAFSPHRKAHFMGWHQPQTIGFETTNFVETQVSPKVVKVRRRVAPRLNRFGLHFNLARLYRRGMPEMMVMDDAETLNEVVITSTSPSVEKKAMAVRGKAAGMHIGSEEDTKSVSPKPVIRKNLQETAFFFPELQTDAEGHISFSFISPEALTRWKLQLFGHSKSMNTTVTQLEAVTQKELMVTPNAPRFLREGDQITFSSKITNLTDAVLNGTAELVLIDPISNKKLEAELKVNETSQSFTADAQGNTQVSWNLIIPEGLQAVQYTVLAKAGAHTDGEQAVLPVLTNRKLVTETLPLWANGGETRNFSLEKLKNSTSTTLSHHQLSLEVTSNPVWYAVQALPYLMEYPYDCNEQIFSRFYANALARHILDANPKIQAVFKQWANQEVLASPLEKNQELKSILISETPWLRDAQSESEQQKRIALLFDLNTLKNGLQNNLNKLKVKQSSSGGWPWFAGGRDNRFITQHIITGLGQLQKMGVELSEAQPMIHKALVYLDQEFEREYADLKKYNRDLKKDQLSAAQLQYLYMRSFFPSVETEKGIQKIQAYYLDQATKYWKDKSLYQKGQLALALYRNGKPKTAAKILKALGQNTVFNEELGRYWKENQASWHWYKAPIETQALLINTFDELGAPTQIVDELKMWLLKNKQTNRWQTTKATTDAIYALLHTGTQTLGTHSPAQVSLGNQAITPSKTQAGTGYFKQTWNTSEIKPEMAEVRFSIAGEGMAWGALYWQYFEDLDKITGAQTPLQLKKELYLEKNTDQGKQLIPITKDQPIQVGDKIVVRIVLKSDRELEFVHMKDQRSSGLEPLDVISTYKWQDGLGYYQSTKDAATHFFFDRLPKGIFVFEYGLRANNSGDFSNGITQIQSMYAPEFSSHSTGKRIRIK